ncbi:MAG: hypothetical protein RBT34_03195 [Anaerolineaceae bacterium]|nr:hypothetical protein [Anaerolineaceae bacterium]
MKRTKVLILLSLSLLLLLACSFGASKAEEQPVEIPTLAPPPVEEPVQPSPPAEEAPSPEAQPVEEQPTAEQPAEEEIAPAGGPLVGSDADWVQFIAAGDSSKEFGTAMGGRFVFELPSAETYSYAFAEGAEFGDVYVETDVETVKADNNGMAVVCRQSDEGWYELRIATRGPNTGSYQMFRYDPSLLARKQNPYVNLLKDLTKVNTPDIINGSLKINTIGLSCKGEELRVFINGVEQLPPNKRVVTDGRLDSGSVGFGAMSFGGGPVQIEFLLNSFTAE